MVHLLNMSPSKFIQALCRLVVFTGVFKLEMYFHYEKRGLQSLMDVE